MLIPSDEANPSAALIFEHLKAWRLEVARRHRIPAFRIMADRTLREIAAAAPTTPEALLAVRGMGPKLVAKYGADLLRILAG